MNCPMGWYGPDLISLICCTNLGVSVVEWNYLCAALGTMKWLWNELVVPLQHAVTGSASHTFYKQRGTLVFWSQSEQLWKPRLATLTRSICCNLNFCILLWGHWSWDQIQLGQVLYKCRQQVIKSFVFYFGNIKILRRWWVSLENEVPPSTCSMHLSYRHDLKGPCL